MIQKSIKKEKNHYPKIQGLLKFCHLFALEENPKKKRNARKHR